jgi:hypothetical protein
MRSRTFFRRFLLFFLVAAASAAPVFSGGEPEEAAPPPEETVADEPPPSAAPPVREWTFGDITEKIWRLAAIRIGYGNIQLNRAAMKTAGMDEIYVLQFKDEGINGKALFNYYFAPYVRHEGKEVAFRQIVGTRLTNPNAVNVGGLGEEEYYWYLQRVTRWDVVENRLVLFTADGDIALYYIE